MARAPNSLPGISARLLAEADSSTTDMLEVVFGYLDGLPPETLAALLREKAIEEAIEDVRDFYHGLRKLRQRVMPNPGELSVLLQPSYSLDCLASAFEYDPLDGAYPMPISLQADIVDPLVEVKNRWIQRFHGGHSHDIPLPEFEHEPPPGFFDPPTPG